MWLNPIPEPLRPAATAALAAGDVIGFLGKASNEYGLDLVARNAAELKTLGIYESALLDAFTGTRANNTHWPVRELRCLFLNADRGRLRAAGDPLPAGPFTLFRGVAGRGPARRIRSFSWTADQERARWFARRFPNLHDPAIYTVTVNEDAVLAYVNDRDEQEFIVDLPASIRPVRAPEE